MKKNLKLGVFGFGCVGQGLYHVLHETRGLKSSIKKICVKHRAKQRSLPAHFFTFDREDLLHDPEIDVVVELIDDADAAFLILKESLAHGKHVVTANKKMLAEHLEEILALQQIHNRSVLYEAAVCGSIPIIRNLEEYYDNDLITGIEGIFNGSTNYILTKIFEEKKSYAEALKQAQELGFAESDPTLDVAGHDPANKLAIVLTHTFGLLVHPKNILTVGIDRLTDLDLQIAREQGYTIRLVARALKYANEVFALVTPQFIHTDHPLAPVKNEYNAVVVQGAFAEKQLFIGKGAGSYPTASAVLSDISALSYHYRYEYKKRHQPDQPAYGTEAFINAYVRFQQDQPVPLQAFEMVFGGYASRGNQYVHGRVSLRQLRVWAAQGLGILLAPEPDLAGRLAVPYENVLVA
jgi:homoserine dehydrogenase